MNQPIFTIQGIQNNRLSAKNAMPIKDSTSDGTSSFEMGRRVYNDSSLPILQTNGNTNTFVSPPQNVQKKWLGNRDSSGVTESRRNRAIGKGSMMTTPSSFHSNTTHNTVNEALTRVRGGGAVAPAKKGANLRNGTTPSFAPVPKKGVYGNKYPVLFH
jgi:hypothetical protein